MRHRWKRWNVWPKAMVPWSRGLLHRQTSPVVAGRPDISWTGMVIVPCVAVEMRRGKHDKGRPELGSLHRGGLTGHAFKAVPPDCRLLVEPRETVQPFQHGDLDVVHPAAAPPSIIHDLALCRGRQTPQSP